MNKRGSLLLPLAVVILLLTISSIWGANHFIKDRIASQKANYYSYISQYESENALIYGIFLSNTPISEGGNKCFTGWYSAEKHELINEEKLPSNVSDYKVKHYISFDGTTDWADAQITGYAEVYDNKSGKLLASNATRIRANMLYKGNSKNAPTPCESIAIKINHNSWRHVR